MPPRKILSSSTRRRHKIADSILETGIFTMRPCSSCTRLGVGCVLSTLDERCEQCYRHGRACDLASPWAEYHRLELQEEKLRQQRIEVETQRLAAEAKAVRLRKQERALQKRRRDLVDREKLNVEELEVDEMLAEASATVSGPEAPNSPTGFSQVSFGSLFDRTSPLPSGNA
jgi:hypothetical protein